MTYNQPPWITQALSPSDIAAINQGGCASGAYMPAVTYYDASNVMNEHGNNVLDYIVEHYGELPKVADNESWSGMAGFYLSTAVELFCLCHEDIADWEDDGDL